MGNPDDQKLHQLLEEGDEDSFSDLSEELYRDLECWSDDEVMMRDTLIGQAPESPMSINDDTDIPRLVSVST